MILECTLVLTVGTKEPHYIQRIRGFTFMRYINLRWQWHWHSCVRWRLCCYCGRSFLPFFLSFFLSFSLSLFIYLYIYLFISFFLSSFYSTFLPKVSLASSLGNTHDRIKTSRQCNEWSLFSVGNLTQGYKITALRNEITLKAPPGE